MVFRHEAPVSGVKRIVPVVSHHEVVILLESIALSLFPVDEYLPVLCDLEFISLVDGNQPLIKRKVVSVESDGSHLSAGSISVRNCPSSI